MVATAESAPATDAPQGSESENAAADAPPPEPEPIDDPVMRAALFETSTPLPDIDSLRPLPPFSRDDTGPVVVQFRIDASGKVKDLERLAITDDSASAPDASEESASNESDLESAEIVASSVERLFRKMRRTRFRPQYEAGAPVETDMIVWSFALDPFGTQGMELQRQ